MLSWILALLLGAGVSFLSYGGTLERRRPQLWIAPAMRAIAVLLLVAALLDAPLGFARAPRPMLVLDASASWMRSGDSSAWRAALRVVREQRRDSLLLFGDSARPANPPDMPVDLASRLQPALLRALGSGRSILLVTDGEIDDPRSVIDALPAGSRIIVPDRAPLRDAAIVSVDAPRFVSTGDSLAIRVALVAGNGGAAPGTVNILLGDQAVASAPTDSLAPLGEQVIVVRGYYGASEDGPLLLRAIVASPGDRESRNDTLFSAVEASTTPGVVFISTSPDLDARYAMSVLRETLSLPTRAFLLVSPGNWRLDGPLTRVSEADVRQAARAAPLVIMHGDTAVFGAPRANTRGALALFSTTTEGGDWYPFGAGALPITGALAGVAWDSLPPIEVSSRVPPGEWSALEARRNRQGDRRAAITGVTQPRRIAVVGANGLWRWAFKGGLSGDAFAAVWGSLFDWLVAERADDRPASPAAAYVRAGEPIRWRRGGRAAGGASDSLRADSTVSVVLTARRAGATSDTVVLRFAPAATSTESPALVAGIYDVNAGGERLLLAVNESFEMVPRRASVSSGVIEGAALSGEADGARRSAPIFVLIVLVLCGEWLLRRRLGLR